MPAQAGWPAASTHSRDRPNRPELPRIARPSRFERRKSPEQGAQGTPSRNLRRILVDFRVDLLHFSILHGTSDSTRIAQARTSVFASRRSTSGTLQAL